MGTSLKACEIFLDEMLALQLLLLLVVKLQVVLLAKDVERGLHMTDDFLIMKIKISGVLTLIMI